MEKVLLIRRHSETLVLPGKFRALTLQLILAEVPSACFPLQLYLGTTLQLVKPYPWLNTSFFLESGVMVPCPQNCP